MWTRRFAKASVRWLLAGWVIAWSMLVTEPCCYAGAACLPTGHGRFVSSGAEWSHANQSPGDHTEHDGCDEVASGALALAASDPTPGTGATASSLLPLPSPAYVAPAQGERRTAALPVPYNATPPPVPLVYLATARLRI